jgi:hypothetical protein
MTDVIEPPPTTPAVVGNHAANHIIAPDAKALRVEHIGKLLDSAYQSASTLKLTKEEAKQLRAEFPDEAIETRTHDGIIYISHMALRERLWDVFGPGHVAEICRERMVRTDSNEIAVDLVLLIRGSFVAEGIGTAKYYPNNPKGSFGDTVESAWSDALRRCCKKFGCGTQVWLPGFIRDFKARQIADKNTRVMDRQAKREEKLVITKNKGPLTAKVEEILAREPEEDDVPF